MADVKKQHYVPQFYLKRFADPDERLYAFNKVTKKSYQTNVADCASQMRFYDFNPEIAVNYLSSLTNVIIEASVAEHVVNTLGQQFVERELSVQERTSASTFSTLLASIEHRHPLTAKQRWDTAAFIALQIVRTPDARNKYFEIHKKCLLTTCNRSSPSATRER